MPNKLPKSWAVLNDGSQLFKNTVLFYLNYGTEFKRRIFKYEGIIDYYYGVQGSSRRLESKHPNNSINIISLEQFIELSKEIPEETKMTAEEYLLDYIDGFIHPDEIKNISFTSNAVIKLMQKYHEYKSK